MASVIWRLSSPSAVVCNLAIPSSSFARCSTVSKSPSLLTTVHGFDQALGFDLCFASGAPHRIVLGVAHRILEHVRDLVVREAVRGFDGNARFDARRRLACRDGKQAVRVHLESHANSCAPATMGGMPRNSKRASDRQSLTSSRSPCTT